jgi:hypothetical protein
MLSRPGHPGSQALRASVGAPLIVDNSGGADTAATKTKEFNLRMAPPYAGAGAGSPPGGSSGLMGSGGSGIASAGGGGRGGGAFSFRGGFFS